TSAVTENPAISAHPDQIDQIDQTRDRPGTSVVPTYRRGPAPSIRPATLDLTDLVRMRRERPTRGWRGAAFAATGGRWNPGLSTLESERARLVGRARTPLRGKHKIGVVSAKGGIGKTTVAAAL